MNSTKMIIWYNPDIDSYQKGGYEEFKSTTKASMNADRFELLHEFDGMDAKLASKILKTLNKVRMLNRGSFKLSVA